MGRWLWGALGERRGAGPELKESRLAPCAPCLSGSPSCPLPCWYRLVAETTLSFPPSPNSLLRLNSSLLELALFCGASHSRSAPHFPFGGPLAVPRSELGALTPWGSEAAPRRSWGLRAGSWHRLRPADGVQGSRWQMRSLRGRVACQGQRHAQQELASGSRAVCPHSPNTYQGPAPRRPALDTGGCLWQGQGKGLNRVSRPLLFHLSTRGRAVGLSPCSVAHLPNPHGPGRSVWFLRAWGPGGSFLISGAQVTSRGQDYPCVSQSGRQGAEGARTRGKPEGLSGSVCLQEPSIPSLPWGCCYFSPRSPEQTSAWEPVSRCTSSAAV